MNKKILDHAGNHGSRLFAAVIAMFPMAVTAEESLILYHELDGAGKTIRSIALGAGMLDLISVAVSVLVFVAIIRFIIGND